MHAELIFKMQLRMGHMINGVTLAWAHWHTLLHQLPGLVQNSNGVDSDPVLKINDEEATGTEHMLAPQSIFKEA
jgi:hypothetical protein